MRCTYRFLVRKLQRKNPVGET